VSLISFGFTIYKFLQATAEGAEFTLMRPQGPRQLGLTLIAIGTISVLLGAIEYYGTIKRLNKQSNYYHNPINFSLMVGIAIGLLGLFLFGTIIIHREVL